MTLEPSHQPTPTNGELMLFAEDSHARTSAMPVLRGDSKASVVDYGFISHESFAHYDRCSSSWKTSQRYFIGDLQQFSETWPTVGLMQSGKCFRRVPSVPHTHDDDCSLWPTPTASSDVRGFGIPLHNRTGRYKQSTVRRVQELVVKHGWRIHPNFMEALMGFDLDVSECEQSEIALTPT